jgi:hypothetical protein
MPETCTCSKLDWAGCDLTAEHHPVCPVKVTERIQETVSRMGELLDTIDTSRPDPGLTNTLYVKDDPFMTPRAGAVVELTYHSPHSDENGLKNLQTIKEVAEAHGGLIINGVRCVILGYVERIDAIGTTLKVTARESQ